MTTDTKRLPISLAALAVWTLISVGGESTPSGTLNSLEDSMSVAIALPYLAACLLLAALIAVMRWRDIGLNAPRSVKSTLILWFPALYLFLFYYTALLAGLPPLPIMAYLFINSLMVGFSEEVMFRGVLYQALLTRVSFWPAVWVSSALFGAVHILNFFVTGDIAAACAQAVAAFFCGILFMAIRLGTGSLWPAIGFHALWDFGTFLMSASNGGRALPPPGILSGMLPILLVVPNFAYGLYLLREKSRA